MKTYEVIIFCRRDKRYYRFIVRSVCKETVVDTVNCVMAYAAQPYRPIGVHNIRRTDEVEGAFECFLPGMYDECKKLIELSAKMKALMKPLA